MRVGPSQPRSLDVRDRPEAGTAVPKRSSARKEARKVRPRSSRGVGAPTRSMKMIASTSAREMRLRLRQVLESAQGEAVAVVAMAVLEGNGCGNG